MLTSILYPLILFSCLHKQYLTLFYVPLVTITLYVNSIYLKYNFMIIKYTVFDLISEHALISEHPLFSWEFFFFFFFTVTHRYNAPRYNADR